MKGNACCCCFEQEYVGGERKIMYDEVGLTEDVLMKDKIDELMRESKFELMLL